MPRPVPFDLMNVQSAHLSAGDNGSGGKINPAVTAGLYMTGEGHSPNSLCTLGHRIGTEPFLMLSLIR
eukprot:91144-Hanusia_phi.AAC.2